MSAIVVQGWLGCRKAGFRSSQQLLGVLCVYLRTQRLSHCPLLFTPQIPLYTFRILYYNITSTDLYLNYSVYSGITQYYIIPVKAPAPPRRHCPAGSTPPSFHFNLTSSFPLLPFLFFLCFLSSSSSSSSSSLSSSLSVTSSQLLSWVLLVQGSRFKVDHRGN